MTQPLSACAAVRPPSSGSRALPAPPPPNTWGGAPHLLRGWSQSSNTRVLRKPASRIMSPMRCVEMPSVPKAAAPGALMPEGRQRWTEKP